MRLQVQDHNIYKQIITYMGKLNNKVVKYKVGPIQPLNELIPVQKIMVSLCGKFQWK